MPNNRLQATRDSGIVTFAGARAEPFGNLTRHSDKFFLGITVSTEGAPYLRMNPLIKDKKRYLELCRTNAEVVVTYKGKKRLIGPIRYWGGEIKELKHNTSAELGVNEGLLLDDCQTMSLYAS